VPAHARRNELYHELFQLVLRKLGEASSPQEGAMYKNRILGFARTDEDVRLVASWAETGESGLNFEIKDAFKWQILQVFAAHTADAETLV
jgi:hypothetical protein